MYDGDAPKYLKELIEVYVPARSLRSINKNVLVERRKKLKTYGEKSFSYAAPKMWNSLPDHVKSVDSLTIF